MRGKHGLGHFEMIISFIFFAGFTFFLFFFLSPQDIHSLPNSVISGLQDSFREQNSVNLSEVFLQLNSTGGDCFSVNLSNNLFSYGFVNNGSYVENLNGNKVNSNLLANTPISKLNINNSLDDESFRISLSSEFKDDNIAPSSCDDPENYTIGSILERKVISYEKLVNMSNQYSSNYTGLKQKLKIPEIFDFSIVSLGSLQSINMEPASGVPNSVDVLAEDGVFEVLKSNGNLTIERISFRIWK